MDSNDFRMVTWRTGLRMIERHPWLGLGPEMPRIQFDEYVPADIPRPLPVGSYIHLHNIYLHYAAERGIPTLLVFLWLMGRILRDFWRGLRTLPPGRDDRRFLLHGGIAVVIATLLDGVTNVNLGDSEVLTMFLVVIACGYMALDGTVVSAGSPGEPGRSARCGLSGSWRAKTESWKSAILRISRLVIGYDRSCKGRHEIARVYSVGPERLNGGGVRGRRSRSPRSKPAQFRS